jgi:hypothetical protein
VAEPKAPGRPRAGTWAVTLAGGEWELGEIAPHFAGSIRVEKRDGWELLADGFSDLEDPSEILVRARELVALINGLARLKLDAPDPIDVRGVRRYRDDGAWDQWVFPEAAHARGRVSSPTVVTEGAPSTPRQWSRDLELASGDEKLQAVLAFLALSPSWHSLHAALDTVLKDRRSGRRAIIERTRGVSARQVKDFYATANSYRAIGVHARHGPEFAAPRRQMTLESAATLVLGVARRWLDELTDSNNRVSHQMTEPEAVHGRT